MLVCRGRGCTVSFQNVHFDACPVVILDGAVVSFDECTFYVSMSRNRRANTWGFACYTVLAQDQGTLVSLSGCSFRHSEHLKDALVVQQGAQAHMERCILSSFCRAALRVSGANTTLTCRRCRVLGRVGGNSNSPMNFNSKDTFRGVSASAGATVQLSECLIEAWSTCVSVINATAHMKSTMITAAAQAGLAVHASRSVTATQCLIQGSQVSRNDKQGFGVLVASGSTLDLSGTRVHENRCGLIVRDNATVTVRSCMVEGNIQHGVSATGERVTMSVYDTVIKGSTEGVHLEGCKDCKFVRVRVASALTGFHIESVQSCAMLECTAIDYANFGVEVMGHCGPVSLKSCILGSSTQNGQREGPAVALEVQGKVHVSADGCTFRPGAAAVGATVTGETSRLALKRCTIRRVTVGVQASLGAIFDLTDCETAHCSVIAVCLFLNASGYVTRHTSTSDETALQSSGSVVHASDCEFTDFNKGAVFVGPSNCESSMRGCKLTASADDTRVTTLGLRVQAGNISVAVSNCVIKGGVTSTVSVTDMQGVLKLHDCEISGCTQGCGVEVFDSRSSVSLKRCTVRDNFGTGILARDGGRVVAEQVHTMRNRGTGYCVCDGASMKLTDCSSFMDVVGVQATEHAHEKRPHIVMRRVFVRDCSGCGVSIVGDPKCSMFNCSVLESEGPGFGITGCTGNLQAARIKVTDCRAKCCEVGAVCYNGGVATLRNVEAVCCFRSGFACYDAGSSMKLVGCKNLDNTADFVRSADAFMHVVE